MISVDGKNIVILNLKQVVHIVTNRLKVVQLNGAGTGL